MRAALLICAILLGLGAIARAADEKAVAGLKAGVACKGCDFTEADLSYRRFSGANLAEARLTGADLTATVAASADFSKANLARADLYAAVLTNSSFREADLSGANLVGTWLLGADLTGANLAGANLSGAMATTAKGLTAELLAGACGDQRTALPKGLAIQPCAPPPAPKLRPAAKNGWSKH
ncbi:MAG: pentapeptide repeat-containing protein [Alphaproteobacteria bacterium]|nr:pentapeptide repeat-containing protein [Alphaproteobacteria bacterium]